MSRDCFRPSSLLHRRTRTRQIARRVLAVESLEPRCLLASGPQLLDTPDDAALPLPAGVGPASIIKTIAGNGVYGNSGNFGTPTKASFRWPSGLAVTAAGEYYISDPVSSEVRWVDANQREIRKLPLGPLQWPTGLAVDAAGNYLYIAESNLDQIKRVKLDNYSVTIVAGGADGPQVQDGDIATNGSLNIPAGVAVDSQGNIYTAEQNKIRKVDHTTKRISTVVSTQTSPAGFGGDGGLATRAYVNNPTGVAVDTAGNIYIADTGNNRIRKVDTNGIINTIAGPTGLSSPMYVAVDKSGNVYFSDWGNNRVCAISAGGGLTTVAGTGTAGFSGDSGLATAAQLYHPRGVAADAKGNLYIADAGNLRVRKVLNTGVNPVDLVVTDFTTEVHNRLGNDADRLDTSITVKNDSAFKSQAFDIRFYAKAGASEYATGDLILGNWHGPGLDPGKSITIRRKIRDPIYMDNPFTTGYYLGVQIDPNNKIAETNKANNFMQKSGDDSVDIALDLSATTAALATFKVLGLATAAQALSHYLENTGVNAGKPIDWGPGTVYSNEVEKSPEFTNSIKAARKFLIQELTKSYKATGSGFTALHVAQKVIGTPVLDSNKDMFFTMHGTQGSWGDFSGIQVTPVKHVGKNTVCTFTANLSITYTDVYEFDADDATKGYFKDPSWHVNEGSCQRHLQMCGWAKPFNDSVTAIVTVGGQFTSNRTLPVPGSSEVASGAILDITAPVDVVAMANAMGPRYTRSASGRILSATNDAALLAVLYQ